MQEGVSNLSSVPKLSRPLRYKILNFLEKQHACVPYMHDIQRILHKQPPPWVHHAPKEKTTGRIVEELDILNLTIFPDGKSLDLVYIAPNTYHPPHIHDESSAVIKIIDGTGVAHINHDDSSVTGAGKNDYAYAPDATLLYPARIPHGFTVGARGTFFLSLQGKAIMRVEIDAKGHEVRRVDFRYQEPR